MKNTFRSTLMLTALVVVMQPTSQAILTSAGNQMWHLEIGGVAGGRQNYDYFGSSVSAGDFNGDGFEDLAIGIPDDGVSSLGGRVSVLYGSSVGLGASNSQIWSQDSAGIDETRERWDDFGYALTSGDFNGDGYDDLAIGAPGERGYFSCELSYGLEKLVDAGMVHVLFGSTNGLTSAESQSQHNEYGWRTGSALSSGDFNDDGYNDLVIGTPGLDTIVGDAGYAVIAYGSVTGLTEVSITSVQLYFSQSDDIFITDATDLTGYALACGDLNGDGYDDMAIGSPGATVSSKLRAGEVHVAYGSESGFPTNSAEFLGITITNKIEVETWSQDSDSIAGGAELDDQFGSALAIADFDNDGCADLAIGVPLENVNGEWNAGMVNVIYGTTNGLTSTRNEAWHQDSSQVNGGCESQDNFGTSLAAGDFNGDGYADLAIGVPEENLSDDENWYHVIDRVDAGMVNVLYGSANGLTAAGDQTWHQDSGGIGGKIEHNDYFGWALAAGDFNGDNSDDLAIGVPGEDIDNHPAHWNEGAVNVIYSTPGNRAPIADAGADTNVVCEVGNSVMVVLDGTASYDPDGHEITYAWEWSGGTATGETPEVEFPLGTTVITLVVSDDLTDSEPDSVTVTVIDIMPPVFNSVVTSPAQLWPPNHKMVNVEVRILATDNCDPVPEITIDSVTMTEGVDDDCDIIDINNIMLRSERTGQAPERVYTLHYSATDDSGNSATTSIDVAVPHDRRMKVRKRKR